MTAKVEIVKLLGEQAILLPSLIAEALNANDRIKLRLTMLQEAAAHASSVGGAAPSLQAERHAAGLSDPQFDRIIAGARPLDGDRIAIPGVTALLAGIPVDMATMLAPVGKRKILAGAVDRLAKEGSLCSRQRDRPR
jgi:hypothetical protein